MNRLDGFDITALTLAGHYDVTVPSGDVALATVRVNGRGEFLDVLGQPVQEATGTVAFDAERLAFDINLTQTAARKGRLAGAVILSPEQHEASLLDLTVTLGNAPWHLTPRESPPTLSWSDQGFAVTPIEFVDATSDERIGVSGSWRRDGAGALHVTVIRCTWRTATASRSTCTAAWGRTRCASAISPSKPWRATSR